MARMLGWAARLPDLLVVAAMLLAMLVMLAGVFFRYVMTQVSAALDLPQIQYYWVEEVGEFSLLWLTFIGAGIAALKAQHFAVQAVVERLPPHVRRVLFVGQFVIVVAFGVVLAYYGGQVAGQFALARSPGLGINLSWLYFATVVGGVLLFLYGLAGMVHALRPSNGSAPIEGGGCPLAAQAKQVAVEV